MSNGGTEEVVFKTIVKYPNGHTATIVTLFDALPEWAKYHLNPQWDHPSDCECYPCWQIKELG